MNDETTACDELPKSWVIAPLDSLCQKFRGVSYGRDDASAVPKKGYVPILRANNLQNDRLTFDDLVWVPADCVSDQQKLRTGDIVVAMSSGSKSIVGKTAQVMKDWQGSFGAFCGVLRAWPELNSRYVGMFLRTREYRNTISELAAGSNINNLKNEHLAAIEVPVAPLAEQRRIVAKLEKLLGQVDACQQRLEKMPTLLKRFRQSILAAACSGRLTADWREENEITIEDDGSIEVPESFPSLPETWRWKSLESVCEKIVDCPHSTPKWAESGRLCVRTTNFKPGLLDLSVVRYVSDATFNERIERLRPKPGDILYSREGGILGIACMIPPKVELCLGQRMMLFRTKSDFSAALLMHWLNSRVILGRVQELTGGSASPHLNVRDIKSFPTPVPPLAEQQEIVRRVAGLSALADQLEQRLAQARGQVAKLTPSLLACAFAGQLVPQNPADEPASVLLERVRKQREQPAKEKIVKVDFAKPPTSQPQFNLGIPPLSDANIFEQRAALNAYVLSQRLHDKKFGRTIMEKNDELFEYDCGLPLQRGRMRDAAGPVDFASRLKVEEKAKGLNWFTTVEHKISGGKTFIEYLPGKNFSEAFPIAEKFMGDKKPAVDRIIKLLKPLSTDDCSIIATLYAAWNDLLIFQKPISDDSVINESRNNWHPAKKNIPLTDWRRGLDWLRKNNVIPKGQGRLTIRKA